MQQVSLSSLPNSFIPSHLEEYLTGVVETFTHFSPHVQSIQQYANERVFSAEKRNILATTLHKQYQAIGGKRQSVTDNITALRDENTFTLTTGQQVHILGGPLFFMTKILDIIALTKHMNETSDGKKYIPVFWLASEDHDLDEIHHVRVYGETYTWDTEFSGGPVGRYTTEGLGDSITQLRERLDDTAENKKYLGLFEHAYTKFTTLAGATQRVLDQLFGERGLVVLDADDPALKELFIDTMRKDILMQSSYDPLEKQTQLLTNKGWKQQAIPKHINMFYMTDTSRARIEKSGEEYIVAGTDKVFSEEGLEKELVEHPESFSPNVFLRPLYQETILPNLVYLAGPGEIQYWLQMKQLFETYALHMPVLLPRQLTQYLTQKNWKKITESPLTIEQWFSSYDTFLELLKKESNEENRELLSMVTHWKEQAKEIENLLNTKNTTDKNVLKSLKKINDEVHSLERRLELSENQSLEHSSVYGGWLKVHKKSFDTHSRFEKDQWVIGQTSIFSQLLENDWTYVLGGVRVVIV